MATVVDKYTNDEKTYGTVTFDDGTETIRAKYFQDLDPMDSLVPGQIVEIIGKVKEYGQEVYLVVENAFERNEEYELLRSLEYKKFRKDWQTLVAQIRTKVKNGESLESLINQFKKQLSEEELSGLLEYFEIETEFETPIENEKLVVDEPETEIKTKETQVSLEKKIVDLIDSLDSGDGAEYSEILSKSNLDSSQVESTINNLLSDGTCYEPRPGKIKRL